MAPTKNTKTSSNATTPSKPKSSTHVADPNPTPAYADQSSSRLMTIPREIRNMIYLFVFCDSIDNVREPLGYDQKAEVVTAEAPIRVPLHQSSPPSKGTILACRELHSELKRMYIAAYRAYWSNNRFVYDAQRLESCHVVLADEDVQHIQQFCLVLRYPQNYYLHVVFENGQWDSFLAPANGRIFGLDDPGSYGVWFECQSILKSAVAGFMKSIAITSGFRDPRDGRGLTRDMLLDISMHK